MQQQPTHDEYPRCAVCGQPVAFVPAALPLSPCCVAVHPECNREAHDRWVRRFFPRPGDRGHGNYGSMN